MAEMTQAAKIKLEIETYRAVATEAYKQIDALTAKLKKVEIPAPPPNGANLTVSVQFEWNPNVYEFLIKHVAGKGYYTTGSMDANKYFATWEEMWAYFNSTDVIRRTEFISLMPSPFVGRTNSWGGTLDRRSTF